MNAPFPAIDGNSLGTEVSVSIDVALIPYLQGAIDSLTYDGNYEGDTEDIIETVKAFEELMVRLSEALD